MSVVTPPECDEPLPTLDGRAWAFGLDLSAAQILESAHARLEPVNARHHLFSAIDPSLAVRLAPDDVIVAEEMIGTMDEAQAALAALAAAGVKALVARHFSPAFAIAGREQGLVLLVLDTPSFIHTDDRVRIDLDAGKVVNLSSGDRAPIRNLDDVERFALRLTLREASLNPLRLRLDTTPALPLAADLTAPILPAEFYLQPTLRVARALLGKILVHRRRGNITAGRIVEVEAYCGPGDRAAHTAGGRRTARNEVMWGPAGRLYVYFTYGMHHCCNVVTRAAGVPEAVLLRALEPVAGVPLMRRRRSVRAELPAASLTRGPGNLCRAMGIDRRLDGSDCRAGVVVILDAPRMRSTAILASPRIGVAYAGPDALLPWRFFVRDSLAVSGPRLVAQPR